MNPLGNCVSCNSAPCSCKTGRCTLPGCGPCNIGFAAGGIETFQPQVQGFTQLNGDISQTVIASLTPCVDKIRDLYTQLGARPYHVNLVHTQWSGGERGVGVEEVIDECPILPTPRVADLSAVNKQLLSVGLEEAGDIRVSEISPRFTEDQLMGISEDGTPVPGDQNFYWEIFFPRADGPGVRRRFTPKAVPNYNPTRFQWWIDLVKAYEDRTRQGDPAG